MADAYIVAAKRTAGGRRGGALAEWHPGDLGAQVLNALVDETGIDPAAIEDVIMGCVMQTGEQLEVGRDSSCVPCIARTHRGRLSSRQGIRVWRTHRA